MVERRNAEKPGVAARPLLTHNLLRNADDVALVVALDLRPRDGLARSIVLRNFVLSRAGLAACDNPLTMYVGQRFLSGAA